MVKCDEKLKNCYKYADTFKRFMKYSVILYHCISWIKLKY